MKARFTYTGESTPQIAEIDTMLSQDELTFRLCEDISIKLCDFFASKSEKNNLVDSIVTYIRENYKNPALCLSKISDEFHISESYFSHMLVITTRRLSDVHLRKNMALHQAALAFSLNKKWRILQ